VNHYDGWEDWELLEHYEASLKQAATQRQLGGGHANQCAHRARIYLRELQKRGAA
jgi:hypothetical protein